MRRHDLAGNQRVFRKVDGQTKTRKARKDVAKLFLTPVALMLMGLDADGTDRNTGL